MKKIGFIFLLVLTFSTGYLANHLMVDKVQLSDAGEVVEGSVSNVDRDEVVAGENAIVANKDTVAANEAVPVIANKKEGLKPAQLPDNQGYKSDVSGAEVPLTGDLNSAAAEKPLENKSSPSPSPSPSAITDEEIDKILPAPFNQQLKNNQGDIREKYKAFADAGGPQETDMDIQNKLTDTIFSNPYSKFLNIESLLCKAGVCEIRLYETKTGAWSYIQAEMQLQEWWSFSGASASGFDTGKPEVTGWYVLLVR